ncbi:lipopolysaccharide biosynthesis protein [Oricola nitratireducens]|uniref:lipopolysaccharide biosynthesis protein n=1 Tax=Oricola nitratireducens TaxID=2775868 RepID=UPI001867EE5F|nr:lipopolysaccharide biosynthesis protein [Oricola nitratireducens]
MSLTRKIVSGAAWSTFETWGRHLTMLAVFVILARHLGPEAIGLATLAMVAPIILAVPVTRGIPEALIQRQEIDPLHLDSAFWFLAAVGAALASLVWAFSGVLADAFGQPEIVGLIRWGSLIVVIQALAAVPAAVLKRNLQFRLFALRTLTGTAVGGTVGIAMAIAGFGMWSIVSMQISKAAVETTVILLGSAWHPRLKFSYAHCRELFPFAAPIVAQSLWSLANNEMPKIILGTFLGPSAVGIYALARRPLDLLVEAFVGPMVTVTMPAVARIQNEPDKIDTFFNAAIRTTGIVGFPAFMGFAAIAPVAIPLVFGEQWVNGVLAVQIIMLVGLQRTIDGICAFTILALGHSRLILRFDVAYTFIAGALMTIAAQFNLEATIAALAAGNFLLLPVFLYYAQRIAGIDVMRPLAVYPRLAIATAAMFAAVSAWLAGAPGGTPQELVLIGGIVIGAVVYVAAAVILLRRDLLDARDLLAKPFRRMQAPTRELG